jgi:hypothetical protein
MDRGREAVGRLVVVEAEPVEIGAVCAFERITQAVRKGGTPADLGADSALACLGRLLSGSELGNLGPRHCSVL